MLLVVLLLCGSARAEQPLVFAVINDVPSTSLAVALLERAYKRIGVPMETLHVPSSRALMIANTGATDGDLFRIAEVAGELPNLVQVPYPLLRGEVKVATMAPSVQVWNEQTLKRQRIGVRRGVIVAERAAEGARVVKVDTYLQLLRLLEHDRIDMALISDIEGISPIHTRAWHEVRILDAPVRSFTLHHYINLEHSDLAEPLAKALRDMTESGETAALIAEHREFFYSQ